MAKFIRKMKKLNRYIFLIAFCIFTNIISGQILTFSELRKLNKLDLNNVETFLLSKKFSLINTSGDTVKTTIEYENENSGNSVKIIRYKGILGLVDIAYFTQNKNEYLKAKEYLKVNKFKPEGTKVTKGKVSSLSTYFKLNDCFVFLTSNNSLSEDGVTKLNWYDIEISDKVEIK